MHRIQIRQREKKCRQSLLSTFLPSIWPPEKTTFWRQNLRGPRQLMMVCIRDECRRRMVQGEFEVGGGTGGATGLPGPGITGHGGITGPSSKLPSPDSPVSDVNSILAGAHLQVRYLQFCFIILKISIRNILVETEISSYWFRYKVVSSYNI